MKRSTTLLIAGSVALGFVAVMVLFALSNRKPNYQYASFERTFVHNYVRDKDTLDLKSNSYYFAGHTSNTLFLGSHHSPSHLLTVDAIHNDTAHLQLKIDTDGLQYQAISVKVDSPYFYMMDGTMPFIYRGDLTTCLASPLVIEQPFITAIPISPAAFALVNIIKMENTLIKRTSSGEYYSYADLLEEQGEGIFSTDGKLLYDEFSRQVVYVYSYRNQFLCMDTSLNLRYRGNTMDSISKAKLKIRKISSENSMTHASPPLVVNRLASVNTGKLYVNSNILSKNEAESDFEKNSVIDVYNLDSGSYLFSFYLPLFEGHKLRSFEVSNHYIICLYDKFVVFRVIESKQKAP